MLRFEAALAHAAADRGLAHRASAEAVEAACAGLLADADAALPALAAATATEATPVVVLVDLLRDRTPAEHRAALHLGATSQDVVDTAAVLVALDAVDAIDADAGAVADTLAALAAEHRDTPQIGRTLGQHGVPTTFGAVVGARLVGVDEARDGLARVRGTRSAVQLGGAVGSLAGVGDDGPALVAALAARLGLGVPVTPWHTTRGRVAELAAGCGVLAGELAALAQDVVLLSSSDVAELAPAAPGRSSAMPHKRNPARAVLAVAAYQRVPGLVAALFAALPAELQRATGRWQSEPASLTDLLRLTGAVAQHTAAALDGLHVDAGRMRATVDAVLAATGGRLDLGTAPAFADRAVAAHRARSTSPSGPTPSRTDTRRIP